MSASSSGILSLRPNPGRPASPKTGGELCHHSVPEDLMDIDIVEQREEQTFTSLTTLSTVAGLTTSVLQIFQSDVFDEFDAIEGDGCPDRGRDGDQEHHEHLTNRRKTRLVVSALGGGRRPVVVASRPSEAEV